MDAAAFGGQVACEEAWAARTLAPGLSGAMSNTSCLSSCTLFNEEGRPWCTETTSASLPGAGPSTRQAATGPAPFSFSPSAGVGSCEAPPQQAAPRVHVVHGIRSGKFVFKGSEEVVFIVNVQLVRRQGDVRIFRCAFTTALRSVPYCPCGA